MEVKRSTQFEKTMSLGVNVIHVINDIQPFSDDELSQVGMVQNMHGGGWEGLRGAGGGVSARGLSFRLATASKRETLAGRNDACIVHIGNGIKVMTTKTTISSAVITRFPPRGRERVAPALTQSQSQNRRGVLQEPNSWSCSTNALCRPLELILPSSPPPPARPSPHMI